MSAPHRPIVVLTDDHQECDAELAQALRINEKIHELNRSLVARSVDAEAQVEAVRALADEWGAWGCDSSDQTHGPRPRWLCPACASHDLLAAVDGAG